MKPIFYAIAHSQQEFHYWRNRLYHTLGIETRRLNQDSGCRGMKGGTVLVFGYASRLQELEAASRDIALVPVEELLHGDVR